MASGNRSVRHDDLAGHAERLNEHPLRSLLEQDAGRVQRDVQAIAGLRLDWTRQRLDGPAWQALTAHAEHCGVAGALERLFAGERVNTTEGRAALHSALRLPPGARCEVEGEDLARPVHAELERMETFVRRVHAGEHTGYTARPIRRVINIGIGGSDLGPRMVCRALAAHARPTAEGGPLTVRFVSNVDGAALSAELREADPETTLFIVASKTFGTQETLTNARAARDWLLGRFPEEAVARHFVAVSTARERVVEFGIDPANMFGFWDWVGGRYSVWSVIGLPVALLLGMDGFRAFLGGAHAMDEHVRGTTLAGNAAVRMALVDYWNQNLLGACARAVLPYDERLALLPAYLQQAEMESLGKRVRLDGRPVEEETGSIVWGAVGTDGQHAFFQLLHQGTRVIPAEFIGVARPEHDLPAQHPLLLANLVAQAQALALGKDEDAVRAEMAAAGVAPEQIDALAPHRTFPGNRPSTVILLEQLDPATFGALIALYEHKIYVLATLWGINAFDQWGVELGKQLAGEALQALRGEGGQPDAATAATLDWLRPRLPAAD
ncbi:glucose-6-phosphate isomerase [Thioalkalivibrio thiocyanoxidans]|uniref:glucose-6-phosphate isomerase n=1 Tax=Thioalkalivibrio thiocyanoxidans TaxID=152475 RepID=UPI00037FC866|nr:glucose-6-phosphate isomerase [Thioalkalivibrio thiocyanoxidans]